MSVEELAGSARRHGLDRIAEALPRLLRPCVRLTAVGEVDGPVALGATRLGGSPDMPEGVEWPMWAGQPQCFFAQIDLSEEALTRVENDLPRRGWLCFFKEWIQNCWGFDPADDGSAKVLWIDAPRETLVRRPHPRIVEPYDGGRYIHDGGRMMGAKLSPSFNLAPFDVIERDGLLDVEAQFDAYVAWLAETALSRWSNDHWMFGHPSAVEASDMDVQCEVVTSGVYCGGRVDDTIVEAAKPHAGRWRLLLQLDSDERLDWNWIDCGKMYCWIPEESIRERRFEDAWCILQGH